MFNISGAFFMRKRNNRIMHVLCMTMKLLNVAHERRTFLGYMFLMVDKTTKKGVETNFLVQSLSYITTFRHISIKKTYRAKMKKF